jgi:hypothetical protein
MAGGKPPARVHPPVGPQRDLTVTNPGALGTAGPGIGIGGVSGGQGVQVAAGGGLSSGLGVQMAQGGAGAGGGFTFAVRASAAYPQQMSDSLFSITPTQIGIQTIITDKVAARISKKAIDAPSLPQTCYRCAKLPTDKHLVDVCLHGRSDHTQRAYRADA